MALRAIEGRCDDMLELPGTTGELVQAFADVLSRALAQALPVEADYDLVQTGPFQLKLTVQLPVERLERVREHVAGALARLGVAVERLTWTLENASPAVNLTAKRRRIRREF